MSELAPIAASYYPGCSLEASALDYAESIEGVARAIGLSLNELPDWNCCGASAAHSLDHATALNLGARNLALAARETGPLLVPCALCFNRLKSVQHELKDSRAQLIPETTAGLGDPERAEVIELSDYLCRPAQVERIAGLAKQSLSGLKLVAYYGCQGVRPPQVTGRADHENPQGMETLLGALGAKVFDWPHKTDCCGASHSIPKPELVRHLVGALYQGALAAGADAVVTGCQMCQANLDLFQEEIAAEIGMTARLPIFYLTELVGLALAHPKAATWLGRHMVSPRPLLAATGIKA